VKAASVVVGAEGAEADSGASLAYRRAMNVLVTGASGLIGSALVEALTERGDTAIPLRRSGAGAAPGAPTWDPTAGRIDLGGTAIDAVVHLAGEPIGEKKWTDEQKRRIRDSRVKGTELLVGALAALDPKPSVLVSGSAVGFYGNRKEERLSVDEDSPAGDDFLADVCRDWEAAAAPAAEAGIRTVLLRTGIVLSPRGGVLKRLLLPYKLGLGGKTGSGRQYMSWISLDDEVGAILKAVDDPEISGPLNATAPHPVTNAIFSEMLGKVLRRPAKLPTPTFALKAILGGELVDNLLVGGQRVMPTKLLESGYEFRHDVVERAFRALLNKPE
jgi:uncharacterized protein